MASILNHITTINDGETIHKYVEESSGSVVEEIIQNRLSAFAYHQQLQSIQYQQDRIGEYPPLQDLADALYWQSKGDSTKMQEYLDKVAAVKEKYPKPVPYVDNIITRDSTQGGSISEPGQPFDTIGSIADSITGAQ